MKRLVFYLMAAELRHSRTRLGDMWARNASGTLMKISLDLQCPDLLEIIVQLKLDA